MAKKLWDKGGASNAQVHTFTVGNDPQLDLELIRWDILASSAHAKMLARIGVLSEAELTALLTSLKEALALSDAGSFEIPYELEDGHSALEDFLVKQSGEAGKKIHTGRSRNDQVLVAQRLYLRHAIVSHCVQLQTCIESLQTRINDIGALPMPGYTHMQPAMPSSVGMWLHAFVENFLSLFREGLRLLEAVNLNPLGAASGFGVPLALDREYTAELLEFSAPQRNPIDVQNSRGRYELKTLRWFSDIASAVEKFSWDAILYSSKEFGFFSLPEELTTGSSIMPQKRNPDVLELLRARASKVRAAELELLLVISKLPSNYHRDLQYSKEPLLRANAQIAEILPMLTLVISSLSADKKALEAAMTNELYATYEAYRLASEGMPFREAYVETAKRIEKGLIEKAALENEFNIIDAAWRAELPLAQAELVTAGKELEEWKQRLSSFESSLFTDAS